jgi:two-component system, LytTR family, response regulator
VSVRALVVDDEPLACRQLRRFLSALGDVEVVGECESGADAVQKIVALLPDVVFLDVQMPHLGGFDVLDVVGPERMPPVVFVTAYEQYAIRALRAHAVDYLLKPVDPDEVSQALVRVRRQLGEPREDLAARLAELLADRARGSAYLQRLIVREGGRQLVVRASDVDWLEAADNSVRVHVGQSVYVTRATLTGFAGQLDPRRFARIHRSTIVNVDRVREIQPWFNGEYVVFLADRTQLMVGPTFRDAFLQLLRGTGAGP